MEELKKWRRDLHRIPELGLQEHQTAAYIRQQLDMMGYQWESLIETGTIVFIDHQQPTTIAFRSDIDALAIEEENTFDYVSQHQGLMHACGHDGHMSALLGLAKRLKESDEKLPHNILLIFQPAEESPGAAKQVVATGVFEKYAVKAIFGMHLMPTIDEGVIACKSGALMAMCGEIDVTIQGQGAHAGLPQDGIDSLMIATHAYQQYQTIVSRRLSPFSPVVLNIGHMLAGTARNSLAHSATMTGTLRCYDEQMFAQIKTDMERIHKGLEEAYGCTITCRCEAMYPPVINDALLYQKCKDIFTNMHYVEIKEPLMLAEDFSFYQKAIPGIFFFLGTKCSQFQSGLHTGTFDFHEDVLEKAVALYYQIAVTLKEV